MKHPEGGSASAGSRCPVCDAGTLAPLDFDLEYEGRRFGLRRCLTCGSAFTAPLPDDATLQAFYARHFDYRWYRDHYPAKLRDSRVRIGEYRHLLGKSVLDFGGGVGYFSAAAREAGLDSITFDPYVGRAKPAERVWDSVVALHVLEHSNDLDRTLTEIKRYLVPGGRLVLAVPNFGSLGYRRLGMGWVWAQPPLMHTFHFTAAGLQALLSRHGFTELRTSYHERWDANLYCDVHHAATFRKWDGLWSLRLVNRVPLLRRLAAAVSSHRRFGGLERAARLMSPAEDCAELQLTAVLPS